MLPSASVRPGPHTSSSPVDWMHGFAAVFAPQGVGVFEATIGMLLKGTIPLAGTALIAAGFRVVILAADLLAFCALQLLRKASAPAVIDRP